MEPHTGSPAIALATLEILGSQWEEWMDAYSSDKPFTAGPLRGSRVRVQSDGHPMVEVRFSNGSQRELFLTDPKNKTDLKNYLIARLEAGTSFSLEFSEEVAGTVSAPHVPGPESLDALCRREPIIKTLLDLFEGRVLDTIG